MRRTLALPVYLLGIGFGLAAAGVLVSLLNEFALISGRYTIAQLSYAGTLLLAAVGSWSVGGWIDGDEPPDIPPTTTRLTEPMPDWMREEATP